MVSTGDLEAPHLIGKELQSSLLLLSEKNLNPRILAQKEDPDLPAGTVIDQTPPAGKKIKPYQSIFLVLSTTLAQLQAPHLIGKPIESNCKELEAVGIKAKLFWLDHPYPKGHCFAQMPEAGHPLENNQITLYVSAGSNKPILWPDFRGKSVERVNEFLTPHGIKPQIVRGASRRSMHCQHELLDEAVIIDQRPLPGSILKIDPEQPPQVQLQVQA